MSKSKVEGEVEASGGIGVTLTWKMRKSFFVLDLVRIAGESFLHGYM